MLATPKDQLATVVVALECVGPRELPFFASTSRLRPGLAVLVRGHGENDPCVTRALESGATGVFVAEFWNTLVPPRSVEVPMPAAPPVSLEAVVPSVQVEKPPVEEVSALPDEAEEISEEAESSEAPSTPRVPWLRYSDGPARTAPMTRTPPPPTPVPPAPKAPPASESDCEPLLTEEELEALMGDDISTIAPKPDPRWRRNDQSGGRS